MSDSNMDRRNFLKMAGAAAAGAAAIPAVPSLGWGDETPPTRLVIFFSANGTIKDRWRPNGTGSQYTIPDDGILTPLRSVKDKLLVVDGIDMESTNSGPGDGHQRGMGHMLTGTEILEGDKFDGGGDNGTVGYAGGISVDQFIAEKVHDGERFKSLEFGVQSGRPNVWSRMSYKGPGQPVEPEQDPFRAFDNIFKPVVQNQQKMQRIRSRRKSVLDFVKEDLEKVKKRASKRDRERVDRHTSAIRELERQLMTGNDEGVACEPPNRGSRFDPGDSRNYPKTGRTMMDMIVGALACRLTRVASIQWDRSVSGIAPTWLGIDEGHHSMSHEDGRWEEELVEVNRWYAEQFAYLVKELDSIPEGDGTVLDNTVVLWCNELGDGSSHTRTDMPIVIAGGGGHFETGKFMEVDRPHNDLLTSVCRSMGVEVTSFGNDQFCRGPMTDIVA
jgi:hypothetical protein